MGRRRRSTVESTQPRGSDDRQRGAAAAPLHRRSRRDRTPEQKVTDLQVRIDAYRDLSTSLALDEFERAGSTT
jgi:hypothetical protein